METNMEQRQRAQAGCGLFPRKLDRLGRRKQRPMRLSQPSVRTLLLSLLLSIGLLGTALPAWARFTPHPCKNAFTEQQEITEGRKAAQEVYKQMPVLPDSHPVSKYVQQLGARLVEHAPGYRFPYNFHVVNIEDINAFALPGGSIFVNLGTIQAAETEAQLAGVIAHEISHVALRHATCNMTKERTPSILAGIGQIAAGVFLPGAAGSVVQQGIGMTAGLSFLKNSRDSEKQADLMGTDILYDTGYDPRAMPQFFEVIQGKYGEGGAQFLSDHPNPGNRVGYVQDEIDSLPPRASSVKTSAEFTRIKKLVAGMHPYTAKQVQSGAWKRDGGAAAPPGGGAQGEGGAPAAASGPLSRLTPEQWRPQGPWQTFQGDGFTISYPGNWRTASSGSSALIAPPGGANEQGAVGYGMLSGRFQPPKPGDIAAVTDQLLAQLQQQNPQLRPGAGAEVAVNGVRGRSVDATNTGGAGGGAERDWLVALPEAAGTVRYLIFVAPQADFEALRPTYEQMLRTLKLVQ
jgi:Zn-dependent protease with chaperone function